MKPAVVRTGDIPDRIPTQEKTVVPDYVHPRVGHHFSNDGLHCHGQSTLMITVSQTKRKRVWQEHWSIRRTFRDRDKSERYPNIPKQYLHQAQVRATDTYQSNDRNSVDP